MNGHYVLMGSLWPLNRLPGKTYCKLLKALMVTLVVELMKHILNCHQTCLEFRVFIHIETLLHKVYSIKSVSKHLPGWSQETGECNHWFSVLQYRISSNNRIIALALTFFVVRGGCEGGHLMQMRGSNVQSLVKNGSQTSLDSKVFILLHVMQLRCSARSQLPHCRVTGQVLGGIKFGLVRRGRVSGNVFVFRAHSPTCPIIGSLALGLKSPWGKNPVLEKCFYQFPCSIL